MVNKFEASSIILGNTQLLTYQMHLSTLFPSFREKKQNHSHFSSVANYFSKMQPSRFQILTPSISRLVK